MSGEAVVAAPLLKTRTLRRNREMKNTVNRLWDGKCIALLVACVLLAGLCPPQVSATPETAPDRIPVEESTAYEAARESGTIQAYGEYMSLFPDGAHATEVKRRLSALRKAATGLTMWDYRTWSEARRSDTPTDYEIYLEAYPHGVHARRAAHRLQSLR
jgi:hypothetical protein